MFQLSTLQRHQLLSQSALRRGGKCPLCSSHYSCCKLADGGGNSSLHLPTIPDLDFFFGCFFFFFSFFSVQFTGTANYIYAHVYTVLPVCMYTSPSLPGFSGMHQKTNKQTNNRNAVWCSQKICANCGSDTEPYSNKISIGFQEEFCLSNVSSI